MSDKRIPLSQLIRIGSKVTTQCRNVFSLDMDKQTTACALWAAVIAKNGGPVERYSNGNLMDLPSASRIVEHPVIERKSTVSEAVQSLNDLHEWTREQIADWLESIGL